MAAAAYKLVAGPTAVYQATSAGDKPASGIPFGAHYIDYSGVEWWNAGTTGTADWVQITKATFSGTIATVDQGDPGGQSWPVVEDNSADILAAVNDLATQSTLQYLTDTVGNTNDPKQTDPDGDGSVAAILKGILAAVNAETAQALPHEVLASGQSKSNSILTVTVNGPAKIEYVVVNYDAAVTANVTQAITSGLGSDFDAELETIALSTQQKAVAFPDGELHIPTGDSYVVEAAAVVGQISSIYVVGQDES